MTPDRSTAVITCDSGMISFLDVAERQPLGTVELLIGPEQAGTTLIPNEFGPVAITPDGGTALVGEENELGQLFVIDVATMQPARDPGSRRIAGG